MRTKKSPPLYISTAELLSEILSETEPGSCLPSEPKLARQLGVSRATLREAMRTFEERGMIVRRQGVGTYVTEPPSVIDTGLDALHSIESLASQLHIQVEMHSLQTLNRQPVEEEIQRLGLIAGQAVIEISRVIQTEGRPAAYLIDIVPEGVLSPRALEADFKGSVLDAFLRQGSPNLDSSSTEISAVSASPEVARLLKIQRGDVLLFMRGELQSAEGKVVDLSASYFIPGIFRFHLRRKVAGIGGVAWPPG